MEAFAILAERHAAGLYRFVRVRVGDDGAAADLVQETFLRALRAIRTFRGEAAFQTWLFTIARRLIVDELRRRRREPAAGIASGTGVSASDPDAWADPASPHPGERLEVEAERRDVREALRCLPEADREMIRMRYQDGLSYEEIAALRSLPLGTVKVRLHRARLRLRTILEERWGDGR